MLPADDGRYGTKMLEKMGWSKGKGLGANEDGSKDFIRVRYKNDAEGLGYEDRDDQWTQHENSFNGLLKTLNGEEETENTEQADQASDDERPTMGFGFSTDSKATKSAKTKLKEKISGESLEEKSKKSKARVHYKKFTRGKDLAQYSEKDLANIFGKKSADDETQSANDLYAQLQAVTVDKTETKEEEEKDGNEIPSGVQIFNSGVSVSDYFKQKMEAIKSKRLQQKNNLENNVTETAESSNKRTLSEDNEAEESVAKKKKKKSSKNKELDEDLMTEETAIVEEVNEVPKKKKKRTKNNELVNESKADDNCNDIVIPKANKSKETFKEDRAKTDEEQENVLKTKKKKKKSMQACETNIEMQNGNDYVNEDCQLNSSTIQDPELTTSELKSKKKKKKSKHSALCTEENEAETTKSKQNEELQTVKEKNVKKSKKRDTETQQTPQNSTDAAQNCSSTSSEQTQSNPKSKNVSANIINASKPEERNSTTPLVIDALSDLKAQLDSYNTYNISSFCAEKFRSCVLTQFNGANMSSFPGYSYNNDLKLEITYMPADEERITKLWSNSQNKYATQNSAYYEYVKKLRASWHAKGNEVKKPRLAVKAFKRRSAFLGLQV